LLLLLLLLSTVDHPSRVLVRRAIRSSTVGSSTVDHAGYIPLSRATGSSTVDHPPLDHSPWTIRVMFQSAVPLDHPPWTIHRRIIHRGPSGSCFSQPFYWIIHRGPSESCISRPCHQVIDVIYLYGHRGYRRHIVIQVVWWTQRRAVLQNK
jgi:hypothetical protein